MSSHFKAFFVVMVLSGLAFWLARPVVIRFMAAEDFDRRRNLWLGLTFCVFLIPSFWVYMGVAALWIGLATRRDCNPAATYLFLLLVIPPFSQPIPGLGIINQVFPLDHFRLLALVLLVPAALRLRRMTVEGRGGAGHYQSWSLTDVLILVYCGLQWAVVAPNVSVSEAMRHAFLLAIDLLLPYYVLSRCCVNKEMIVEAISAFALAAFVLAPIAVFETAKGWLMYSSIADYWQVESSIKYLLRDEVLRAQATSGQSIILGNFYAVALGLWLYLQAGVPGWRRWLGTAAIAAGLVAALARGPWVGAAVCLFVFFATGPKAKTSLLKFVAVSAVVAGIALASPAGGWIIDHLPFVGTVDEGSIAYRQLVIDRAFLLIRQNPLFGSPYFIDQMEDLRTGEGIIDLLNVYLAIGMAYGLVTLAAFVSFLLVPAIRCLRAARAAAATDPDTSRLGAALFASMSAAMLIMYTVSNYLSVPFVCVGLAALMVAYARVAVTSTDQGARAGAALEAAPEHAPADVRASLSG